MCPHLLTVIPVGVVGMILAGGEYNGCARHMRVVDCENVSLPQTIAEDSAGGDPGQAADEASLGISQVEGWTKPSRVKQKLKYRAGLYSPAVRVIRQTAKGKLPTLFGLFDKKR
jgi:hypothetical protein